MSIRIMSAIFESETLGPTERLIMLSLADHADDDGRCYPSIARLCQRTGLSERAVQTNVKKLTEAGYIKLVPGGGRANTNLYFISANPAADAPRSRCTPAADAPQTPQQMRLNPAADAPEPSGTIREPSKRENVRVQQARMTPDGFDDFWEAYPHRNGKKTKRQDAERAFSKAIKSGASLEQIADGVEAMHRDPDVIRGYARDPTTWLNQRGWTDEIPENRPGANNDNRPFRIQPAHRPAHRPDPALERIARLAGLSETPGYGRA